MLPQCFPGLLLTSQRFNRSQVQWPPAGAGFPAQGLKPEWPKHSIRMLTWLLTLSGNNLVSPSNADTQHPSSTTFIKSSPYLHHCFTHTDHSRNSLDGQMSTTALHLVWRNREQSKQLCLSDMLKRSPWLQLLFPAIRPWMCATGNRKGKPLQLKAIVTFYRHNIYPTTNFLI